MSDIQLSFACGDYEITRGLTDGSVKPDGITLMPDTRFASRDRHWAMAKDDAFDVCEFNACAYFMARDRGRAWTALPAFCHRRFRHGFIFVNPASGIREPKDLIGRKIGGTNFQPAGNVWIRGILEEDYGVPHDSIHWFTERGEDVDFSPHPGLKIERIGPHQSLDDMALSGELDGLISPEFPAPFLRGDPRLVRLFPDYKEVERDYYRRGGIFPIMHVTVVKRKLAEREPWIIPSLMRAFEESKARAYQRVANPRVVPLAWWSAAWEEQQRVLGSDPWAYGLTASNRKNLDAAIRHTHRQGLISRIWRPDELFAATPSTTGNEG